MKKEYGDTLIGLAFFTETWSDYDKALSDFKSLCKSSVTQTMRATRHLFEQHRRRLPRQGDTDNALTYLQQSLQLRQN